MMNLVRFGFVSCLDCQRQPAVFDGSDTDGGVCCDFSDSTLAAANVLVQRHDNATNNWVGRREARVFVT